MRFSSWAVIYALRDLFIWFFGKEVEALKAFYIEGGRANAEKSFVPFDAQIDGNELSRVQESGYASMGFMEL